MAIENENLKKTTKNAYKKRKNENFEKQKNVFLSHVPRIIQPKNRFLGQKVCSVARGQTNRHTDRHTRKLLLWAPFQGFRSFFPSTHHQGSAQ